MKTFEYVIKDEIGIHARPADQLVKETKNYKSVVKIAKADRSADATSLLEVMSLAVKCGDNITVTIDGEDEKQASETLQKFFEDNL